MTNKELFVRMNEIRRRIIPPKRGKDPKPVDQLQAIKPVRPKALPPRPNSELLSFDSNGQLKMEPGERVALGRSRDRYAQYQPMQADPNEPEPLDKVWQIWNSDPKMKAKIEQALKMKRGGEK